MQLRKTEPTLSRILPESAEIAFASAQVTQLKLLSRNNLRR
jgi:hypothetical protein